VHIGLSHLSNALLDGIIISKMVLEKIPGTFVFVIIIIICICKFLKMNHKKHCRYKCCGLVVRVPGYRSKGPGSVLGATRFSEK
jgi:hypothetical protein